MYPTTSHVIRVMVVDYTIARSSCCYTAEPYDLYTFIYARISNETYRTATFHHADISNRIDTDKRKAATISRT